MRLFLISSACAMSLAACTQPPAEVAYKGDAFYGQDPGNYITFTSNGYQERAGVGRVAASDLKPVESKPPAAPPAQKIAFIWPVEGGHVIAHFSAGNDGINIAASEGRPIHAAADGTVIYAGNELKEYGNMVILRHAQGFMTAYAHASALRVKKHDQVRQGDTIAAVGKTGNVREAQLHFGMRSGKQAVDPEQYLPKNMSGLIMSACLMIDAHRASPLPQRNSGCWPRCAR